SRPMDDVLEEAAALAADGALELNLVAQDLTAYGRDRRDGASLAVLLRALAVRVPAVRWLRLLYAYPASVTDELLEVMATEPPVCQYLDMPLQHISDRMLRAMRRERSGAATQVGLGVEVLVEEARGRTLVGRTRTQAPEIDGVIRLVGEAAPGTIVRAVVTGADTYDLRGEVPEDYD